MSGYNRASYNCASCGQPLHPGHYYYDPSTDTLRCNTFKKDPTMMSDSDVLQVQRVLEQAKQKQQQEQVKREQTKPKLLLEWSNGRDRFRLIEIVKDSASYVINKLATDDLGEPRWDREAHWFKTATDKNSQIQCMLADAIKFLLHEQDEREALKHQEADGQ